MMLMSRREKGQAMAEFAVVAPVILMLIAMVYLAYFYLWRTANVDWALFAASAANGSYDGPRGGQVLRGVWDDLQQAFAWSTEGDRVSGSITYSKRASGMSGVALQEIYRGQVYFRLWRFYPGPRR